MKLQQIVCALIVVAAMTHVSPARAAEGGAAPTVRTAGDCTRFFQRWKKQFSYENDEAMLECSNLMGIDKFCADRGSRVVVGYAEAPGTWEGQIRLLKCSPSFHPDTIGDQFIHIWTGIGEGLLTAAPFVAEGVLAFTCAYGQIYACAVLALEVSEQAGLEIPGEIDDAIYIANKAPQCIDGDVVACAYLGARGAKAVGLEIPGIPGVQVLEDAQKCNDNDFAACVRLGKAAADAGGLETGSAFEGLLDAQDCLDGNKNTCVALAKEAIKDQVPVSGVSGAAESAAACNNGDTQACVKLGRSLSAAASGLSAAPPESAPFGANACISAPIAKGPVDLASMWQDQHATSVAVFPSDGSRFGAPTRPSTREGGWADTAKWAAADFNNDGVTDVAAVWDDKGDNTITVRQSNGRGLTPVHWAIRAGTWSHTTVWLPGDFNGDGRIDIAGAWNDNGQTSIAVFLSDGARFAAPTQWSVRDGGWSDGVKWAAGDFDGDGKSDIAAVWNNGGSNTITVRRSTGSGFAATHWAANAGGWSDSTTWLAGDFNGDSRLDLAAAWRDGNEVSIAVYASDGHRFPNWSQWSSRDGGWIDAARWVAGDFNGDGKSDVAAIWDNGGTNTMTVRQSTGAGFTPAHWATNAGGWSESAAWCAGRFPSPLTSDFAERKSDHSVFPPKVTAGPVVKAQGRVKLASSSSASSSHWTRPICDVAKLARARNSPAAPGLEAQCAAFVKLPLAEHDDLIAKGEAIAREDPLAVELLDQQPDNSARIGFDIGMAVAEKQTAYGPGKQHIHDSLPAEEQSGFRAAVDFLIERNRHGELAAAGAAIARADPVVAAARDASADVFYRLGFDIASAFFGDPALGGLGNTGTGPGSLGVRDTLSVAGQDGFNAAAAFHFGRNYKP